MDAQTYDLLQGLFVLFLIWFFFVGLPLFFIKVIIRWIARIFAREFYKERYKLEQNYLTKKLSK